MLPSLGFTINPAAFAFGIFCLSYVYLLFFMYAPPLLPWFSERYNVFEGVIGALVVDGRRHRLVCICV